MLTKKRVDEGWSFEFLGIKRSSSSTINLKFKSLVILPFNDSEIHSSFNVASTFNVPGRRVDIIKYVSMMWYLSYTRHPPAANVVKK